MIISYSVILILQLNLAIIRNTVSKSTGLQHNVNSFANKLPQL